MRSRLISLVIFLIAVAVCFGYIRRSMFELNTNTGCPYCKLCEDWLDDWYPAHLDEICLVRYHTNGPSSSDPFHTNNPAQNNQRAGLYSGGYVPQTAVNGDTVGSNCSGSGALALSEAGVYTPLEIEIFVLDSGVCEVTVLCEDPSYDRTLNLICILNEDSMYYAAPNGQTNFYQVMRYILPDWDGEEIRIVGDTSMVFEFDFRPYFGYVSVWENCWFTVLLQDFSHPEHEIPQCNKKETDDLKEYFHILHVDRIQELVFPDDTVVFDFDMKNYGLFDDDFDIWFESHFPAGWFVQVSAGGSEFDSSRITLESRERIDMALTVSPMGDIGGGYAYLYIDPVNDPDALIDTICFKAYSGGDLLLISSTEATEDISYYEDMFADNGVDYGLWSIEQHGELPDFSDIAFDAIVWQDGENISDPMTSSDRLSIKNFLENGGKMLITSSGLGRSVGGILSFYTMVLGAIYDGMESAPTGVMGTYPGTDFSGFSATLPGFGYPAEGFLPQAPAEGILRLNIGPTCGLTKDFDGGGKLVYISFNLETIASETERDDFWERVITYWGGLGIDENELPRNIEIIKTYPNPFNSVMTVELDLRKTSEVIIEIYDISGKLVTTIYDGTLPAGRTVVRWDSDNAPSGVYLIRLSGDVSAERKTVLIK